MPRLRYVMPGIEPMAAGDGKAAVCCLAPESIAALKPRTDKGEDLITAAVGTEKAKLLEASMKTMPLLDAIGIKGIEPMPAGDGKALVCC